MFDLPRAGALFTEDLERDPFDLEARTLGDSAFSRGVPNECQCVREDAGERSNPQANAKHALNKLVGGAVHDLIDDCKCNRGFVHV